MKTILLVIALAAMLALAACASNGSGEQSEDPTGSGSAEEPQAGMPNPWSDVASAEEAAAGAGVGTFEVADNLGVSDMTLFDPQYRCMEGIAEVDLQGGAFQVTVHKGAGFSGQDLSGDYTEYPLEWTQDCDGVEVSCRGYEEGMAAAFDWTVGDASYSVMLEGLGGEEMAVDAEDVATIVASVK